MMYKQVRYGMAILGVALSCVTVAANASYSHCNVTTAKGKTKALVAAPPCDVSFTAIPSFAAICLTQIETGLYTIRNNTPVTITINYIRIKSNDGLPTSNTTIVTAPTNNCGGSLAAGASCNILVSVQPTVVGTLNRILQIGVDTRQVELDGPAINFNVCSTPPAPSATLIYGSGVGESVPFNCTILGGSTVTNTGATAVNGNVCLDPGTSVTGFPPGIITNGGVFTNGPAATARSNYTTIENFFTGLLPACVDKTGQNLGGLVLTPGTYCFASSAQLTGALTLNGPGFYYFIIGSTLTTASASSVVLIGGATSSQVFWDVGSSATLGTTTAFQGNIFAGSGSITVTTGASISGRAITGPAGAVTLDTNAVSP